MLKAIDECQVADSAKRLKPPKSDAVSLHKLSFGASLALCLLRDTATAGNLMLE